MQWVPGDPKEQSVNLGRGENIRKSGWKGGEDRSLRVLIFRVKLRSAHMLGGVCMRW